MLSSSFFENETSNLAECYMSIRTVFDGANNTIVYSRGHLRADAMQQG